MRIGLVAILLAFFVQAFAVPARKMSRTITVDGQSILVELCGDESCHYWAAADGSRYTEQPDGTYALLSDDEVQAMMRSPRRRASIRQSAPSKAGMSMQPATIFKGEKRGLMILVNFADNQFTLYNPQRAYSDALNKPGYVGAASNVGSLSDYFKVQSYGQFDLQFDVVGPVTLSQPMEYYGENRGGSDCRPASMVVEACKAVDDQVDFSEYDWDGDGVVEQVFVLYAGYSEAQGAPSNTIWPHEWSLSGANIGSIKLDGVTVNQYACSNELRGTSGVEMDGIGTICHELSHCFGLPDFYCTNNSHDNLCVGYYSVMDYGCYCGRGKSPCSYTAFERWSCGWLEPTVLNSTRMVEGMESLDNKPEAYVIYNDAYSNEFYMLQNFQNQGWNARVGAHGLMILHVDYNRYAWEENYVNNSANHLRMSIVCADDDPTHESYTTDLYPNAGNSLNTIFSDDSSPAATLFYANTNGRYMLGKAVSEIKEKDRTISFVFTNGRVPVETTPPDTPTDLAATLRDDGTIEATWTRVPVAETYNIMYGTFNTDITDITDERELVSEDFAKLTGTSDSNTDICDDLDDYLNTSGFDGFKLYRGKGGMKMSTSNTDGFIVTPVLNTTSDSIAVTVSTAIYATDGEKASFRLRVYSAADNKVLYTSEPYVAGTCATIDLPANGAWRVGVIATKRLYLSRLRIVEKAKGALANSTTITGVKWRFDPYTFTPAIQADQYWLKMQAVSELGIESEWTETITLTKHPLANERMLLQAKIDEAKAIANPIDDLKAAISEAMQVKDTATTAQELLDAIDMLDRAIAFDKRMKQVDEPTIAIVYDDQHTTATITLTSPDPDVDIFYTLDYSTEPILYTQPIVMTEYYHGNDTAEHLIMAWAARKSYSFTSSTVTATVQLVVSNPYEQELALLSAKIDEASAIANPIDELTAAIIAAIEVRSAPTSLSQILDAIDRLDRAIALDAQTKYVATPTMSFTYNDTRTAATVALSTADATIYYLIDNETVPVEYTAPFVIQSTETKHDDVYAEDHTITVWAIRGIYSSSPTTYTIQLHLLDPPFDSTPLHTALDALMRDIDAFAAAYADNDDVLTQLEPISTAAHALAADIRTAEDNGTLTLYAATIYMARIADHQAALNSLKRYIALDIPTTSTTAPLTIYTLTGHRVHRITTPGAYIINGKKTIIRTIPTTQ